MLPANDPIMPGTLIWSFRQVKCQNLTTGDDFMHSSGIGFLLLILATRVAVAPLSNDPIMLGNSTQFKHQNMS